MGSQPEYIYHIVTPEEWGKACQSGTYTAPSLQAEGFIHFSYLDQVLATAERYYSHIPDLLVLKVDIGKLTVAMKVEQATHGGWYPHLYGELNLSAVIGYHPLKRSAGGSLELHEIETWDHLC
jgi:uncharacterized protein (DUF952 family)